jgi:hypothetical protein
MRKLLKKILDESYQGHNNNCLYCAEINELTDHFLQDNPSMFESIEGVVSNKPIYLYKIPMFMVTVSVVFLVEDKVILIKENDKYRFPGGVVRAGLETIPFSVVRHAKEQTDILIKKEELIPVDYRSDPSRSEERNVIDIGMLYVPKNITSDFIDKHNLIWKTVDFENKYLTDKVDLYMDHDVLLERALEMYLIMKNE